MSDNDRYERMFGMSKKRLDDMIEDRAPSSFDRVRFAQSILSDAQEQLQFDQPETVRQMLNVAKYVLEPVADRLRRCRG